MPTITIDGEQLYYTVQGRSQGSPTLLLLHGAGGTHLDWPVQLRRLAGVTVYTLDLPGHGRSSGPGRQRIEAYAEVVNSFINALQLAGNKLFLFGHSMGGAIAQTVALQDRPSLSGLILVGTGARLRVAGELLQLLSSNDPQAAKAIASRYWSSQTPDEMVRRSAQALQRVDPQILYGDYLACHHFDVMDRLGELKLPALVISATEDRLTPLNYGRYLADNLPDARLVIVSRAAHMMVLEQPQPVAATVRQFIAEVA